MCRKHFTCHIPIHITRSVLRSPCLTCGYHKECAKNISPATSPSTSRKMTPGHGKWLVAMADDFTTFICPTGPAVYVKEPRIIHDSIMVLPEPSETEEPRQQLPMPPQSEHPDPDKVEEPEAVDPQILLQESERTIELEESVTSREAIGREVPSGMMQRASARSNKGTITSKKFTDEDFNKRAGQTRMAKIAWNIN